MEEYTPIDRQRPRRPLRRTRAVIGLLLLTTTNENYNSYQNSYSSGLAVAFTTPLQQRISPSHPPISISSSSLFAKHRSSNNAHNNNEQRNNVHNNNNSKKRKSTELEVSQHYLQGIGEATYNNTIISNAELPRGFSFADDEDDEALADSDYGGSGEEQSYEVSVGENNLQGTLSSSVSSSLESTIATNGASEEYTINMSKYYINDDNYDGDHYDYDMNAEIDGSLIGT